MAGSDQTGSSGARRIVDCLSPRAILDAVRLDLRLSIRVTRKHPALTVVAIAALTLGIPTSLIPVHLIGVLDAPPDLPGGEGIVALRHWDTRTSRSLPALADEFFRWRDELTHFEAVGASSQSVRNVVTQDGIPLPLQGSRVSASLFDVVRVTPLLGRPLLRDDERPQAVDVVVIGYEMWRSHLGADPDVVGRRIRFDTQTYTVVGVMPEGFAFPHHDQFWLPLRARSDGQPDLRHVQVVGRLAPGASQVAAEEEFRAVIGRHDALAPEAYRRSHGEIVSVARAEFGIPRGDAPLMFVAQLFALAMLTLACGCVGVLVLARTTARLGEFSIRSALGASRLRIVGQLFMEAVLVGLMATGFGLLLIDQLARMWRPMLNTPAWGAPSWLDWGVNPPTAIAAIVLGVLSAVLTGVLPGLRATGRHPHRRLVRATFGSSAVGFGWGSTALVAAMVSTTICCLAVGATLMPGLFRDRSQGMGLDASHYLAAELGAPSIEAVRSAEGGQGGPAIPIQELFRRALEEEPGVRGVAFARFLPGTGHRAVGIELEGGEGAPHEVLENAVYPGFFRGLGAEVLRGRAFHPSDLEGETLPAVVNTSFVADVLGGRNPIGQRFRYAPSAATGIGEEEAGPWFEIVGMVGPLGMNRFSPARDAGFYLPAPATEGDWVRLAIHVGPDPGAIAPRVRTVLGSVSPFALIRNVTPLSELPDPEDTELRLTIGLMGAVMGVAGLLGVCGLYALVAFTVERRRREIGVRRSLGARASDVVFVVVRRAVLQLAIGIVVGGAAGWIVVQELAASPRVDAPDVSRILTVLLVGTLAMGVLSCLVPTLRSLRIAPSEALSAADSG